MISPAIKRKRKSLVPHCLVVLFVIQAALMFRWFILDDAEPVDPATVTQARQGYAPTPSGHALNKVAIASQEVMPAAPQPSSNPATAEIDGATLQLMVVGNQVSLGDQLDVLLSVEGSVHPAPILDGTLVQVDGGNIKYFALRYQKDGQYVANVNTDRLEPGLYQVALDIPIAGNLVPLTSPVTVREAAAVTAERQVN